jgi:hypothetical protein
MDDREQKAWILLSVKSFEAKELQKWRIFFLNEWHKAFENGSFPILDLEDGCNLGKVYFFN